LHPFLPRYGKPVGFEAHNTSTVSVLSYYKEDLYGARFSIRNFTIFLSPFFPKISTTTFFNSAKWKSYIYSSGKMEKLHNSKVVGKLCLECWS